MKLLYMIVFISFLTISCGDGQSADDHDSDLLTDSDNQTEWECLAKEGEEKEFLGQIGCSEDFLLLSSLPMDSSIPGARSVKTVIDRMDENRLYFQNSKKYKIHWEFARAHLSGKGKPFVDSLEIFNSVEYYSPERRFILGAVTKYEGPGIWAYEISPSDTASAEMIADAYYNIAKNSFFGNKLYFHPTSSTIETIAEQLPEDILIITTKELFKGVDYQPLNLGTSYGKLNFVTADKLDEEYVNFRDIVVLDKVPNDISVVSGIITAEFQTPLSHINVLSQNRGTPNMAYSKALTDKKLTTLEDKWVKLTVSAFEWDIEEATKEDADKWWNEHKPPTIQVPAKDVETSGLIDIDKLLDTELEQKARIKKAIPFSGGKASHYAELYSIEGLSVPKAFVIPIHYYDQFLKTNGIDKKIETMLKDKTFQEDARTRDLKLAEIRDLIEMSSIDPEFLTLIKEKISVYFEGNTRVRFRSSTNAEDLEGFTGAGLYTSKTGDINDPEKPVEDAVRKVWASVWFFRAFEERSYRGISHADVGMALLVHRSFPEEFANGVALTANPFDTSGLVPAFYINVQRGDSSVVLPDPNVKTDQILYQYDMPGSPIIYLDHSNLIPEGETVLSNSQVHELGKALKKIHLHFYKSYGPPADKPSQWYAMDVEFKFDEDESGKMGLVVKQARPHYGRGGEE
ncbi:MAG TPA: PEP/pyruvate-binding domain-containing protein [bacterium]|nr:PEP/pyruvate-binding domain-containing protein [bacterium]